MPEYREVAEVVAERANRSDWDAEADQYQAEHGDFLGDARFIWCPEGLDESEAGLLGQVDGRRVLEIGAGAAHCARWLIGRGAVAVAFDLSFRQLQHGRRIDEQTGSVVPTACATVTSLPFAGASFDLACSAFGAFPFVVDIGSALAECLRVLRPGGRLVFSVVHPARRMFADDPTANGTTIIRSYFDRRAYVETDDTGEPAYVEPHHTIGDWVEAIGRAGLLVERIVEPEWRPDNRRVWGGWGPVRGALLPGTAIFVTRKPPAYGEQLISRPCALRSEQPSGPATDGET